VVGRVEPGAAAQPSRRVGQSRSDLAGGIDTTSPVRRRLPPTAQSARGCALDTLRVARPTVSGTTAIRMCSPNEKGPRKRPLGFVRTRTVEAWRLWARSTAARSLHMVAGCCSAPDGSRLVEGTRALIRDGSDLDVPHPLLQVRAGTLPKPYAVHVRQQKPTPASGWAPIHNHILRGHCQEEHSRNPASVSFSCAQLTSMSTDTDRLRTFQSAALCGGNRHR
jgi:hypothetical protein